jgi:hypothetical protein
MKLLGLALIYLVMVVEGIVIVVFAGTAPFIPSLCVIAITAYILNILYRKL